MHTHLTLTYSERDFHQKIDLFVKPSSFCTVWDTSRMSDYTQSYRTELWHNDWKYILSSLSGAACGKTAFITLPCDLECGCLASLLTPGECVTQICQSRSICISCIGFSQPLQVPGAPVKYCSTSEVTKPILCSLGRLSQTDSGK